MSFSWTSVTQNVTKLQPIHFNEVQTNTNALCAGLGIANYGWTVIPVSNDQPVNYAQLIQLRNALDYTDNNNVCSSHHASHFSAAQSIPHNSSYNNSVLTGHLSSYNSSYDNNVDTGHLTNYNSAYDNNVDTGHLSANHGSHRNAPHFSAHFNNHKSLHNSAVQATQRSIHLTVDYGPHNFSYVP